MRTSAKVRRPIAHPNNFSLRLDDLLTSPLESVAGRRPVRAFLVRIVI